MYNVTMGGKKIHEEVNNAFEECVAHANALLEFYESISQSLSLGSDAYLDKKLTEAAIYNAFYCRQQLQGISIEVSQKELGTDDLVHELLKILRDQCDEEITTVKRLLDGLNIENPTKLQASFQYILLKSSRKNHIRKLNYLLDDAAQAARSKKSATNKSYMRAIKGNATTCFFDDSILILSKCIDDVVGKYEELVSYREEVEIVNEDEFTFHYIISNVELKPLVKPFLELNSKYTDLKSFFEKQSCNVGVVKLLTETVDLHIDIKKVNQFVNNVSALLLNVKRDSTIPSTILSFISRVMVLSNILESSVELLAERKELLSDSFSVNDFTPKPFDQANDPVLLEAIAQHVEPQIAVLHAAEPPVRTENLSSAELKKPAICPQVKDAQKIIQKSRSAADNLKKVKSFDKEVLAMFFTTPAPHFKMSEKQFTKFMKDIGATVNDSSGNGSAVKISLDPKSVLIAPGTKKTATALCIHKQHKSGHVERSVPSYAIKDALDFFRRAGLYEHLHEEYQKYIQPKVGMKPKLK